MAWKEPYNTKKGIRYIVRWREGGKQYSRLAGAHARTANSLIEEIEESIVLNSSYSESQLTVNNCVIQYLGIIKKVVRPRTYEIARLSLEPFKKEFGEKPVQSIQAKELEQFKNRLLEFRKIAGINIIIRNLKTFFNFCVRQGYLKDNAVKNIEQFKEEKVARFLNREEMAKLCRASSKPLRRFIYVLYKTGMRLGEFMGIKEVGKTGVNISGKTGPRHIPLRPMVRKMLLKAMGECSRIGYQKGFQRAAKRARLGRVRVHDLRHTWASAYLKSGGTLADLRVLGGWTSLAMLERYAHFQEHYLAERMVKVRL